MIILPEYIPDQTLQLFSEIVSVPASAQAMLRETTTNFS